MLIPFANMSSIQRGYSLACASGLYFLYTECMAGEFNTGEPIAYFLTWTTYGTWLPGDDRGWNRKGEFENLPSNPLLVETADARMNEDPFLLSAADRQLVEHTIGAHCEFRGWDLHAVNVRSNHAHVVVAASAYKPDRVASQFKAWCTRKLKAVYPNRERFWTEGTSCRWINTTDELAKAIEYTLEAQDRNGVE